MDWGCAGKKDASQEGAGGGKRGFPAGEEKGRDGQTVNTPRLVEGATELELTFSRKAACRSWDAIALRRQSRGSPRRTEQEQQLGWTGQRSPAMRSPCKSEGLGINYVDEKGNSRDAT